MNNLILTERILRFALWMVSRHRTPSGREIQAHFEISKPTAYRWLRAWKDANGLA